MWNFAKLECDEDGVLWRALVPPPEASFAGFTVVTVDGVAHTFNASMGAIVSSRQLAAGTFESMGAPPCTQADGAKPR